MRALHLYKPKRDIRLRSPDFSLEEAAKCFAEDRSSELAKSTLDVYRSWQRSFIAWLPEGERDLARLNIETAQQFCRIGSRHTRMNKAIALKQLAKYLASTRMWYEGEFLSVLRDLKQTRPSPTGQSPYTDQEVRAIYAAVSHGVFELRNRAVVAVELHGFRGKEARDFLLRNVVAPARQEKAHLIIETSKTSSGIRQVPLDAPAYAAIREYIRIGRPDYKGTGAAPLFIGDDGKTLCESGWNSMTQRLRRMCREAGVPFRQHRLRSTSVRLRHEAGWPDSANIAFHGWSPRTGQAMLARYRGPIPVEQLKRYPSVLDRVLVAV